MLRKTLLWTDLPPCREAPDFKCVTPRQVMALPPSTPAIQVTVMPPYCLLRQQGLHTSEAAWKEDILADIPWQDLRSAQCFLCAAAAALPQAGWLPYS